MFVLYFLALLVPLVLFHELGHFLVARWMGVRVLSFSIGFGPTVLRWERGGTEYAVRALPLGGFVRMLGDDPSAPPDEPANLAPDAFTAKPVWRRALIVAAGPIANIILPVFILFFGALLVDGRVMSSRLGTVMPDGPADRAGLRPGDRIVRIDGEEIVTFEDLRRQIAARPGRRAAVEYERAGRRHSVAITPASHRQVRLPELGLIDIVGRIEVRPDAQNTTVAVRPGTPAWQAGIRSGDRIARVGGRPTLRLYELADTLRTALAAGAPLVVDVANLRLDAPVARSELQQAFERQHDPALRTVRIQPQGATTMEALGLLPAHLIVGPVEKGSPADRGAGLVPGDEVVAVDGVPARSFLAVHDVLSKPWDDVRADPTLRTLSAEDQLVKMHKALERPHVLRVRHMFRAADVARLQPVVARQRPPATALETWLAAQPDGASVLQRGWADRDAVLQLAVDVGRDARPALAFGANGVQDYVEPEMIENPALLAYAVRSTRDRMTEALQVTVLTVAGLFRGHVPVKEVGGPIFMAQLASKTADLGWGYFFELMVWLSVNLAILNLLPIPLVDGGHLLFLLIEAIKREPVSLRARQIAAYVGMSFLGLLFVVVMKNDTERVLEGLQSWASNLIR